MIITRIIGGLGNQMFQYAVGRSLANLNNTELMLDISAFRQYPDRNYMLNKFNIVENYANDSQIQKARRKKRRISIIVQKIYSRPQEESFQYFKEKHFYFDPKIFRLKKNVYLEGYWQSEKYFKTFENLIKNDFKVKMEPDEINRMILDEIEAHNSIGLHIRRGDYVTSPIAKEILGPCNLDYYNRCVGMITKRIDDPYFFIFSDEPSWSKKNIHIDYPTTYVSHNPTEKGYEDIRLMSRCKHFIIANSTFSWWGAWLARNPEKIVFAPKVWFKNSIDTRDLIPRTWIRV